MTEFADLLELRHEKICGIGPWVWLKADQWAWQQPKEEFPALRKAILAHTEHRSDIVCAGGCLGMYPRLWAEDFAQVYTFEPYPFNFNCLAMNCQSPRIIKFNAALGEKVGMCSIEPGPAFNVGMHKVSHRVMGGIPILPLDAFEFHHIDVLQLDVEGYEPRALRGAARLIHKFRPVISVEGDVIETRDLLEGMGYREVARVGANPDIVFVPR